MEKPIPNPESAFAQGFGHFPGTRLHFAMCDSDGTILYMSPGLPQILGVGGSEPGSHSPIGQPLSRLMEKCVPLAVSPGGDGQPGFPIRRGKYAATLPEGDRTILHVDTVQLAGGSGDSPCVCVSMEDVSEWHRSEVSMRVRGRGLDASILPVGISDNSMVLTYANFAMVEQWRADGVHALHGIEVADLWESSPTRSLAIESLTRNGEWSGQLIGRRVDGTHFEAFASLSRVTDVDDMPVGYMVSCLDLSARVRTEAELRRRIEIEQLISKISTDLLDAPPEQLEEAMHVAIAAAGRHARADRCFFTLVDVAARQYGRGYEWCREGVQSYESILEGMTISGHAWGEERLIRGEEICFKSLDELPPEAWDLRELYEQQGVKSNVTAPLIYGGNLKGFIGFDTTESERLWSSETIGFLRMVGEVLAVASERQNAHKEFQRQMEFERIISSLSTRFINLAAEDTAQGIYEALETLGKFLEVDRAYFNYISEGNMLDGYEWCSGNTESQPTALDNIDVFEVMAWSANMLAASQVVNIPNVDELPPEAAAEKEILKRQDVKSTVIVPLVARHRFVGFIGFETVHFYRVWNDSTITMLTMVAQMFANAEERRRNEAERVRLEQQIRHSQKLESLGVLAGGIAHDFNNLLVGILGNAGVALLDLPDQSPVRQSIQHIEDAARHAAELTNQLLAYSGKGQFAIVPINMNSLIHEMMGLLESVKSKKAVLKCHLSPDVTSIEGDASQIKQIIMNLVTNASDAIGDQDGTITIATGICEADRVYLAQMFLNDDLPEGRYVHLDVSDTGAGMDNETLQKIFDPFFTTKFTGRGLGLAAVLGIVRSHGGAIRVESQPKQGTTFRVLFPCSAIPVEAAPAPKASGEWQGDGIILVVDDEPIVRDVATRVLQRYGFSVLTANDGVECLEVYKANQDKVSCILLDMTMPVMDGVEVCMALQDFPRRVPVLLSSGYTELETTERISDLKVSGFIQKPYSPRALIDKLREVLDVGT